MQPNLDEQPTAKPAPKKAKDSGAFDITKFMTRFMKDHEKTLDKLAK